MGRAARFAAQPMLEAEKIDVEWAICSRIRTAVSAGDLPPGTKLPEEAIADSFSTTRTRVRSAFQRLGFEGLIDLQKNRGAFIARPTVKEARDIFEARRVIERVTTEIVTRTILTHRLRSLGRTIEEQRPYWLRGNRQLAISGISAFHLALAALAHNAALTTALERLIFRTSLILGLYSTAHTFASLPAHYDTLMVLIESGRSLDAARQIERCLSAVESALEFYSPLHREVDVKQIMRTLG